MTTRARYLLSQDQGNAGSGRVRTAARSGAIAGIDRSGSGSPRG